MKIRRNSEISDSEDSLQDQESKNLSHSKNRKMKNNYASSSDSSSSSSDSERKSKHNSSLLNQTPPSTSTKIPVTSRPIEKFFQQNPGIKKLPLPDVLLDNDEVCYLEAPKMIDPGELLGKVINFVDKTKIKINRTKYVIEPSLEDIKPLTILTKNLKVIHPVAFLRFREYSKRKKESGSVESEQFAPSFPDNLKVRHPLFGAQYEDKIALDEEIQKKLDNTIDQFVKKVKKKKKHKEKAQHEEEECIFTLLESHSLKKKKKKHNEDGTDETRQGTILEAENFEQEDEKEHKFGKKKKKREKKEEQDEDINQELISTISEFDSFRNESEEEKNKKKQKINVINNIIIPSHQFRQEAESLSLEGDSFQKKKKKHKKEKKAEEMRLKPNASLETTDFEIHDEHSFEKKGKKRKKEEEQKREVNQEPVSTALETDSFKNEQRKEEKNKKKINIINDILIPNQLTNQTTSLYLGESFEKKKKEHKRKNEKINNNIVNSTIIPGLQLPTFEFDISSIMSKEECAVENDAITQENVTKVSPKKQKNQNESLDNSVINDDSRKKKKKKRQKSDDEDSEVSPKKKHKKDKEENEETTNSLILDILSRVKSEMDTSSMKHKKKKRSDR